MLAALRSLLMPADVVISRGCQGGHRHGLSVVVDRHHRKEATVDVPHGLRPDVFCQYLNTNFHGCAAGEIDACQKRHQLSNMNGLSKGHVFDVQGHHIATRLSACTRICDFI